MFVMRMMLHLESYSTGGNIIEQQQYTAKELGNLSNAGKYHCSAMKKSEELNAQRKWSLCMVFPNVVKDLYSFWEVSSQ